MNIIFRIIIFILMNSIYLIEKIQKLKQFPHVGTKLYKDSIETKYRYIRIDNYYAFYYTDDRNVYFDRFIYAKRDFMKLLSL